MSDTIRRQPASPFYLRRLRHAPRLRGETMAADETFGLPARHHNRIASRHTQVSNPREDRTVSHFRGQDWHRATG